MARMRTVAILGVVLCGTLGLSGCGSDDNGDGGTSPGPGTGAGEEITYPLAVGNSWTYNTTTGKAEDTSVTTVVGTQVEDGKTYYVLETVSDGERDSTLMRQEGQVIYAMPLGWDNDMDPNDPMEGYMLRFFQATLPWKLADFSAGAGTSWSIGSADTTVNVEGTDVQLSVTIQGYSDGRTSVQVPAGSFTDVYKGRVLWTTTSTAMGMTYTLQMETTFWVADGVGLVRSEEKEIEQGQTTATTTDELVSYEVQ
jgi:hypothetical protein